MLFLAFYKNWLPFDLLYGFHCFRSCFVSFKHGLRCGPNGSSFQFLLCKLWVANSQWRYQRHCLAVIIAVSVCLFLFVFRLCLAGSLAASALRRHCVGPALALRRPCVGPASALRRQCVGLASALRRPCVGLASALRRSCGATAPRRHGATAPRRHGATNTPRHGATAYGFVNFNSNFEFLGCMFGTLVALFVGWFRQCFV